MYLTNPDSNDFNFLVVGGGGAYVDFFSMIGNVTHIDFWRKDMDVLLPNTDCIVFTGGADVNPAFYGRPRHKKSCYNNERDMAESHLYHIAAKKGIPMVGICRGAQFLTVMNNGELVQDVNGHALGHATHTIRIKQPNNNVYVHAQASSTHHQMMYPFGLPEDEYVVLASAAKPLSDKYETVNNKTEEVENLKLPEEPEIVFYPYTDCLCIQGHPEFTMGSIKFYQNKVYGFIENMLMSKLDDSEYRGTKVVLKRDKFSNVNKHGNVRGEE